MKYRPRSMAFFFMILVWLTAAAIAYPAEADKSAAEKSEAEKAVADKTAAEKHAEGKTSPEKPAADKASPDKAAAEKPAAEKSCKEESSSAAPTFTVKREPFKIQIELEGVFEGREMTEIALYPEEWSNFLVREAVDHGSRVKKGDVLVVFDREKIDKEIADLRTQRKIAEVALKQAEDQLSALEKTTPLDLEDSQRAQRIAEEDRKYYFEIGRPMVIKTADSYLKFNRQYLEYSRQELEQLEKMYKADDLIEETEKLVLQRARDKVEREEFYVELEQVDHDHLLKYLIPRRDQQIKEIAQRTSLAWGKDRVELPLALEKQRREVEKQKLQLTRSNQRLKDLSADQKLMKIEAPTDGYVYYGRCQRGKFTEIASLDQVLRRGGSAAPRHVLMTIVKPRPIFIHSTADEDHLQYLRRDLEGIATPTGYPDIKLDVTVDEAGKVPVLPGDFDLQLSLDQDKIDKALMPGMTCKIKFVPYLKTEALTLPPKAVMTDPLDDAKRFVYLQVKDGKPEKREVSVGKQNDKQVEILKGLAEGDKVLQEAPKDSK
jgi:HlyD family secretion protein